MRSEYINTVYINLKINEYRFTGGFFLNAILYQIVPLGGPDYKIGILMYTHTNTHLCQIDNPSIFYGVCPH